MPPLGKVLPRGGGSGDKFKLKRAFSWGRAAAELLCLMALNASGRAWRCYSERSSRNGRVW